MAQLFRLEEFAAQAARPEPDPFAGMVTEAEAEAARREAHDRGYRSGWDEAVAAAGSERTRIGTEFARNLRDLGFTYHEARAHVMRGIEPLLEELLASFLPRSMREALGRTILDELEALAAKAADAPLHLAVAPADAPALRELLNDEITVPLELVEESTLAEGQVHFRLGQVEREIDLSGTLQRMQGALRAAADLNARSLKHG